MTILADIRWSLWIQILFGVLILITLNKWGGLSVDTVLKTLVKEIKDLSRAKPTIGALNAVGIIIMALVAVLIVTSPVLEDLVITSLSVSRGTAPSAHDNVPSYVCFSILGITTLGSIFAARS